VTTLWCFKGHNKSIRQVRHPYRNFAVEKILNSRRGSSDKRPPHQGTNVLEYPPRVKSRSRHFILKQKTRNYFTLSRNFHTFIKKATTPCQQVWTGCIKVAPHRMMKQIISFFRTPQHMKLITSLSFVKY